MSIARPTEQISGRSNSYMPFKRYPAPGACTSTNSCIVTGLQGAEELVAAGQLERRLAPRARRQRWREDQPRAIGDPDVVRLAVLEPPRHARADRHADVRGPEAAVAQRHRPAAHDAPGRVGDRVGVPAIVEPGQRDPLPRRCVAHPHRLAQLAPVGGQPAAAPRRAAVGHDVDVHDRHHARVPVLVLVRGGEPQALALADADAGAGEEVAGVDRPGLVQDRAGAVVDVVGQPERRLRVQQPAPVAAGLRQPHVARAAVQVAAGGDDAAAERDLPGERLVRGRAGGPAAVDRVADGVPAAVGAHPERPHGSQPPADLDAHAVLHIHVHRARAVAHQHRVHPPAVGAAQAVAVPGREAQRLVLLPGAVERLAEPARARVHRAPVPQPAEDRVVEHHVADRHAPAATVDEARVHADDVAVDARRPHLALHERRVEAAHRVGARAQRERPDPRGGGSGDEQ
jgi:hypothetical protein